jgi:hypothetical protein
VKEPYPHANCGRNTSQVRNQVFGIEECIHDKSP